MKKKINKAVESEAVASDSWIDGVSSREVSFGGRNGHVDAMRAWAIKEFGSDAVALMGDCAIEKKILEAGYLPVHINGDHNFEYDCVFLIKKAVLKTLPCFSR